MSFTRKYKKMLRGSNPVKEGNLEVTSARFSLSLTCSQGSLLKFVINIPGISIKNIFLFFIDIKNRDLPVVAGMEYIRSHTCE